MKQKNQKAIAETTARRPEMEVYPPAQMLDNLVVDEESWLLLIDPACRNDAGWPERLARHLYEMKEAIKSGAEGARLVTESIDEGIRVAYEYTPAHRAGLRLFYLCIAGELYGDSPEEVLNAAIEQSIDRPGLRRVDMPKDLA
jgi:hypothetical protein